MAIQGTQIPMYIKHTLFLYFSGFSIFFNMKKKTKKNLKRTQKKKKNMLNKIKYKN